MSISDGAETRVKQMLKHRSLLALMLNTTDGLLL